MDDEKILYVISYREHIHYEDFEDYSYGAKICRGPQVQAIIQSLKQQQYEILNVHKFHEDGN